MAAQPLTHDTSLNVTLPNIPELFNPNFLDVLLPEHKSDAILLAQDADPANPPVTTLISDNRTYTENGAPALSSTGSAALDAFNSFFKYSYGQAMYDTLAKAWTEDPGMTLRLIWNIRSIHDGKGEKELFYRAFGWLYDNHPRTALSNLHWLITPACTAPGSKGTARPHGYWKDLLNILALETCNQLVSLIKESRFLHNYYRNQHQRASRSQKPSTPEQVKQAEEKARAHAQQRRKELHEVFHKRLTEKLAKNRRYRALYITVARLFAEQLRKDISALQELESVEKSVDKKRYYQLVRSITLVGKWAPTPGGSHDRVTNISTAICQLLFSPAENVGKHTIGPLPRSAPFPIPTDRENCLKLRSYYGRWILRPLREILCCPEPLMSAKRWSEIEYTRVPSTCMASNKAHFIVHDLERFQQYMIDVESGKKKISGATLMPHELVAEAVRLQVGPKKKNPALKLPKLTEAKAKMVEQQMRVIDAQWRTLVSRLKENGTLDNSLAVCDVSGSMGSINYYNKRDISPIFPSVALSLLLATLAKPPFNGGFITFSEVPEFVRLGNLEETSLRELVKKMVGTHWGMNTDFQAVFLKLLLPLAKQYNVAKGDMVKRLFVFSDMQFDEAITDSNLDSNSESVSESGAEEMEQEVNELYWKTSHDLIEEAYKAAGYNVPEIVYWNLSGERTTAQTVEVEAEKKGVAMMSGFSAAMMKVFMGEAEKAEGGGGWAEVTREGEVMEDKENEFTPLNVMKKALFKKSFDGLVVVD